jgi:hypothetical protein
MPIVHDMPMERYQALKALSAGGAWLLTEECPAIYWQSSPWNDAAGSADRCPEFDIGTAAHLAILEPGELSERIVLVDAPDWRTNTAKLLRDDAYSAGRVPLLPKNLALVSRLADAVRADRWTADLLDGAEMEVSFFWEDEGRVPCKARADLVSRDGLVLGDVKTASSSNPRAFQRAAFSNGYFLRPAWYLDGWGAAKTGSVARDYWFIVIGKDEPHVVTVCRLDPRALEWGRMMCRHAVRLFRKCRNLSQWPGYCEEPATLSLPAWAEYQLADREQAGEFSVNDLRRAAEFLQP